MTVLFETLEKARAENRMKEIMPTVQQRAFDAIGNLSNNELLLAYQTAALRVIFEAAQIVSVDLQQTLTTYDSDLFMRCATASYKLDEYGHMTTPVLRMMTKPNLNRALHILTNGVGPKQREDAYRSIEIRQLAARAGIHNGYKELYGV